MCIRFRAAIFIFSQSALRQYQGIQGRPNLLLNLTESDKTERKCFKTLNKIFKKFKASIQVWCNIFVTGKEFADIISGYKEIRAACVDLFINRTANCNKCPFILILLNCVIYCLRVLISFYLKKGFDKITSKQKVKPYYRVFYIFYE